MLGGIGQSKGRAYRRQFPVLLFPRLPEESFTCQQPQVYPLSAIVGAAMQGHLALIFLRTVLMIELEQTHPLTSEDVLSVGHNGFGLQKLLQLI